MNGPEHYQAAEQLLARAGDMYDHYGKEWFGVVGLAQVHASLAQTAAIATMSGPQSAWGDKARWNPVLRPSKPEE